MKTRKLNRIICLVLAVSMATGPVVALANSNDKKDQTTPKTSIKQYFVDKAITTCCALQDFYTNHKKLAITAAATAFTSVLSGIGFLTYKLFKKKPLPKPTLLQNIKGYATSKNILIGTVVTTGIAALLYWLFGRKKADDDDADDTIEDTIFKWHKEFKEAEEVVAPVVATVVVPKEVTPEVVPEEVAPVVATVVATVVVPEEVTPEVVTTVVVPEEVTPEEVTPEVVPELAAEEEREVEEKRLVDAEIQKRKIEQAQIKKQEILKELSALEQDETKILEELRLAKKELLLKKKEQQRILRKGSYAQAAEKSKASKQKQKPTKTKEPTFAEITQRCRAHTPKRKKENPLAKPTKPRRLRERILKKRSVPGKGKKARHAARKEGDRHRDLDDPEDDNDAYYAAQERLKEKRKRKKLKLALKAVEKDLSAIGDEKEIRVPASDVKLETPEDLLKALDNIETGMEKVIEEDEQQQKEQAIAAEKARKQEELDDQWILKLAAKEEREAEEKRLVDTEIARKKAFEEKIAHKKAIERTEATKARIEMRQANIKKRLAALQQRKKQESKGLGNYEERKAFELKHASRNPKNSSKLEELLRIRERKNKQSKKTSKVKPLGKKPVSKRESLLDAIRKFDPKKQLKSAEARVLNPKKPSPSEERKDEIGMLKKRIFSSESSKRGGLTESVFKAETEELKAREFGGLHDSFMLTKNDYTALTEDDSDDHSTPSAGSSSDDEPILEDLDELIIPPLGLKLLEDEERKEVEKEQSQSAPKSDKNRRRKKKSGKRYWEGRAHLGKQ